MDGGVVLEVIDRGVGVAPADHARILERSERAVAGERIGGLGLGLWIARQIVDAHGGTIDLDSAPGRGSTFRVRLPTVSVAE